VPWAAAIGQALHQMMAHYDAVVAAAPVTVLGGTPGV